MRGGIGVTDQTRVCVGAMLGAVAGAAVAYLFYTARGRTVKDRIEPAVDDIMGEFRKFRGTIEKVADMANDGMRALQEFQSARSQQSFSGSNVSH